MGNHQVDFYSPNFSSASQALTAYSPSPTGWSITTWTFPNYNTWFLTLPTPNLSLPRLFHLIWINRWFFTSQNNSIILIQCSGQTSRPPDISLSSMCHTYRANHVDTTFKLYYSLHGHSSHPIWMEATASPSHLFPPSSPDACCLFSTQRLKQFFKKIRKQPQQRKQLKSNPNRITLY